MLSRIPILLVPSSSLPLSISYLSHRVWPDHAVAECCRAAASLSFHPYLCISIFASLSYTRQGRKFFCSSRYNWSFFYARALTSVLLWLCTSFWHCVIQSIWHWTGENETTRKPIPQTINFISKTSLQNVVQGGDGFFSFCFTHLITLLLWKS